MFQQGENTTCVYRNEFNEYIKVELATSEDVFDYLFDIGDKKFILDKGNKYLHDLFKK